MKSLPLLLMIALAQTASGSALGAPARSATIQFGGGSVAFIGSASWGSGKLRFAGKTYPLSVGGVGVGAIGASKFSASGEVFNIRRPSDIEGTYSSIEASATAGAGAGTLDMKNQRGVRIHAHATSAGLKLALAPTGMTIKLK